MKKIKKILTFLLVMTLIVGMTACSGGANDAASTAKSAAAAPDGSTEKAAGEADDGGRTVTICMYKEEPAVQAAREKYLEQPMRDAFPNDTVNFTTVTSAQEIQVQIAGGSGPDIIDQSGPTETTEYAKAGRVADLTPYAEKYGWKDLFFEWAWNTSIYDGKLYSLPNCFEGCVTYFNTDVFEANGWAIPTNESEMVDVMQKAQAAGIIPISFGNADYKGAVDQIYTPFLNSYAGPAALKEVLEGKRQWSDPLIQGSIEKLVEWWKAGYIGDKKSQALTADDMLTLFTTGKAAMNMGGTWGALDLILTYPDCNWDVTLPPELRDGVGAVFPLAVGGCFSINASSKDPDFAAEVLNWMFTSTDRHLSSVREGNFQPYPIKIITAESFKGMDERLVDLYGALMAAQESGDVGYCAWTFFPDSVRDYMNESTDGLFLDTITMDEYIATIQKLTDEAIAEGAVPILP